MTATCILESCSRTRYSKLLCDAHWRRFKRTGDPRPDIPIGYGNQVGDPVNLICTIPGHTHDQLGACTVCGVPTVAGLHPHARTKLLLKRPDLAHLAP